MRCGVNEHRLNLAGMRVVGRLLAMVAVAVALLLTPGTLAGMRPLAPASLTLSVIDVGQGDSILVTTSDGHAMLVDGGPASAADDVFDHLRKAGIDRIDVLICTHPHEDHIGGLVDILDAIEVGRAIDSGQVGISTAYERCLAEIDGKHIPRSPGRGVSSFSLGPATVKILWPAEPLRADTDDASVVARVIYGKFSALLTGDISMDAENELISRAWLSPAVVLKVAGHGGSNSTSRKFLQAVKPAVAIISVGEGNPYGHPSLVTLSSLQAIGAQVFRTDKHGTVTVTTDGETWSVQAEGKPSPVTAPQPAAKTSYYGSKNSNVFHYGSCRYVRSIKSGNLIVFSSRENALSRGYRPCSVCNP